MRDKKRKENCNVCSRIELLPTYLPTTYIHLQYLHHNSDFGLRSDEERKLRRPMYLLPTYELVKISRPGLTFTTND